MNAPERVHPRRILVVDDDPSILAMTEDLLSEAGFEVGKCSSAREALERIREHDWEVVLSDLQMPGSDGLELLAAVRENSPDTPVIIMTAFGTIQAAVDAMRAGALDFVTKPFRAGELLVSLERAFERRALEQENRELRRAVARTSAFGELVGKSPAMNEIYALIRKIGASRSHVLITGESGTGKEVVARTIHFSGARGDKPFVPINCTAMPEGLLESELFGHVRGAFTGAYVNKKGLFEAAAGGTLFLDEIGDMPISLQGKLLRVLQDKEVRPVGGNQSQKVDVRIIAATHQDMHRAIQEGRFRQDLYYRLNVIPIRIPPLRERAEDIPVLAEAFLRKHANDERAHFSNGATRKLMQGHWPGNARELENCIERALALSEGSEIQAVDILIPSDVGNESTDLRKLLLRLALERRMSVRELTDAYIEAALETAGGRKSEAARLLGMNRRTLYRREEREDGADPDGDESN